MQLTAISDSLCSCLDRRLGSWVQLILCRWRATRMRIFQITPLARRVQAHVLQTFDVSEQAAEDYAAMK